MNTQYLQQNDDTQTENSESRVINSKIATVTVQQSARNILESICTNPLKKELKFVSNQMSFNDESTRCFFGHILDYKPI